MRCRPRFFPADGRGLRPQEFQPPHQDSKKRTRMNGGPQKWRHIRWMFQTIILGIYVRFRGSKSTKMFQVISKWRTKYVNSCNFRGLWLSLGDVTSESREAVFEFVFPSQIKTYTNENHQRDSKLVHFKWRPPNHTEIIAIRTSGGDVLLVAQKTRFLCL